MKNNEEIVKHCRAHGDLLKKDCYLQKGKYFLCRRCQKKRVTKYAESGPRRLSNYVYIWPTLPPQEELPEEFKRALPERFFDYYEE